VLPRCRVIGRLGIGYDMVDIAAATRLGVAVANAPDYCTEEVAAHTLALVLAHCRGIVRLHDAVRAGRWSVAADAPDALRPSAADLAVVGFGRIGSRVAAGAAALGFRVRVHDPHIPDATIAQAGHLPVGFDAALESDVVTLHAPLTSETRYLIDGAALARMRHGALLVKTCRGGLVDEAALAGALRAGTLGGAAVDVFETEPLPADHPLRSAPNTILNPHAAWYSPAALAQLPRQTAEQVVDFLAERPVANIVNPTYLEAAMPRVL